MQANSTHIASKGVVSRLAARIVASDFTLVSLCERWLDQQRAIQRCYARYSPGDPPDALIIGLLNGSDDIERQIADAPSATRQGLQAKAKLASVILDEAGGDVAVLTDSQAARGAHHPQASLVARCGCRCRRPRLRGPASRRSVQS
jgi:hypothetical protein